VVALGFDGVDFDWEFPSWPQADNQQRRNFTLLLGDLHSALKNISKDNILSVAVAAPQTIVLQSYEISKMAE
jgi:chitinase